jgi:hypothetical protein
MCCGDEADGSVEKPRTGTGYEAETTGPVSVPLDRSRFAGL